MTSGRALTSAGAAAASPISAAAVTRLPAKLCGLSGASTSTRVSVSIGRPLSAPASTSRAVSLRPIIPAAPVMRMCMAERPFSSSLLRQKIGSIRSLRLRPCGQSLHRGAHHRLNAAVDPQLGKNGRDLVAHSLRTDPKPASDGVVVEAFGNELQHLALADG